MKKKRIAFLVTNIFDLGGVQRVVSVLANELNKEHNVEIICVAKNVKINRDIYNLDENIKVHVREDLLHKNLFNKIYSKINKIIHSKTALLDKKFLLSYLTNIYYPQNTQKKLIKFLNLQNYDIIVGVEGYLSIILSIISEKLNSKTIGWQHNSFDAYLNNKNRYYYKQNEIFKTNIPKLDKYIVLTDFDKKMFKEKLNVNTEVIENPRSFTSEQKSTLKNKQFLAAGRFTYQKGFDLLIESFFEFSKSNKEWNLVIVGEGEEKENIEKLISKFKLKDRIKIYEFTNDIKKYFLESSVLLLPSRWEGMPMLVLESMEMGVPIISYDISAVKQIISNNEEGILVKKYNNILFSQAMIDLVDNKCIEKSKYFSIENIISKWFNLFSSN